MFTVFFIILQITTLITAKICIEINTSSNSSDVLVNYSGIDVKIVSDYEIDKFGINSEVLTEALKKHYGRRPSDVFLKSPTPWGDLYKKYHWEEVKRILSIKSAKVKSINKQPVIILSQDFENSLNNTIKVNTGISQTVENSITTVWTKNKEIVLSQEVEYNMNDLLGKASGSTSFAYTTNWGESEEKSETTTIGAMSSVETELQPGQQATAVLTASRGYLEVEVTYKATLRGNVAVNFKKAYNNHHFWGPPIENVLKSGGIGEEHTAVEIIKIGFYLDSKLNVYDKNTGKPL